MKFLWGMISHPCDQTPHLKSFVGLAASLILQSEGPVKETLLAIHSHICLGVAWLLVK